MLRAKKTEKDKQIENAYKLLKTAVTAGNYEEVTRIALNLETQEILVPALNYQDFLGTTVLMYNAMSLAQHQYGKEIFEFLLKKGAEPGIKNNIHKVAFELIASSLSITVYTSLSEDMQAKIYASLPTNIRSNIDRQNLKPSAKILEYAEMQLEQSAALAALAPLASVPADIWTKNGPDQIKGVYKLLKEVAQKGNDAQLIRYISELEGTEILVPALNRQDFLGTTVLMYSIMNKKDGAGKEIFKLLLEKGADPTIKDFVQKVAFQHISDNTKMEIYNSLSEDMKAAIYNSLPVGERDRENIDIQVGFEQLTSYISTDHHQEALTLISNINQNILQEALSFQDSSGKTVLHHSALKLEGSSYLMQQQNEMIFNLLLEAADSFIKDNTGATAYMLLSSHIQQAQVLAGLSEKAQIKTYLSLSNDARTNIYQYFSQDMKIKLYKHLSVEAQANIYQYSSQDMRIQIYTSLSLEDQVKLYTTLSNDLQSEINIFVAEKMQAYLESNNANLSDEEAQSAQTSALTTLALHISTPNVPAPAPNVPIALTEVEAQYTATPAEATFANSFIEINPTQVSIIETAQSVQIAQAIENNIGTSNEKEIDSEADAVELSDEESVSTSEESDTETPGNHLELENSAEVTVPTSENPYSEESDTETSEHQPTLENSAEVAVPTSENFNSMESNTATPGDQPTLEVGVTHQLLPETIVLDYYKAEQNLLENKAEQNFNSQTDESNTDTGVNFNDLLHSGTASFKGVDSMIDLYRLIHEPNVENARTVLRDVVHFQGIFGKTNILSVGVSVIDIAGHISQGEMKAAGMQAITSLSYMALPSVLAYTAIPYVSTAYGVTMLGFTAYHAASNAYALYEEQNSADWKIKSDIAYQNLYEALADSPLQQLYDFKSCFAGHTSEGSE